MSKSLGGKVVVVTGGARGVGGAISAAMAAAGARVLVNDVGCNIDGSAPSAQAADELVQRLQQQGLQAAACHESVETMQGGQCIMDAALDAFGQVDALVCAAGILRPATIFDMSEADWDDVLRVHLKGHFALVQPASRIMRKQRSGSIITLTSSGGLEGAPLQPNYSAAKEGIIGLTRAVALSLAPYATCNAICPSSWTRTTEFITPAAKSSSPPPEMVAPLAVFLAGPNARHVTGQVIHIGGERVSLFPQPRPLRSAVRSGGWTPESLAQAWDAGIGIDKLLRYDRYVGKDQDSPGPAGDNVQVR